MLGGAVALAVLIAAPAQASAAVDFKVALGTYDNAVITCSVNVEEGSDGIAVLDAAVAIGCIDSYHTIQYSFGEFVTCINHVCDLPWHEADQTTPADSSGPLYWEMFVNGESATYGVSDFESSSGDELAFRFTTWVTCLTPAGCL